MPKRFLKPELTTSDRWNASKWITQSFYVRLITLVDDYGRYDARPAILRAHAFPLRLDVTDKAVTDMCEELAKNDLAIFYKSGDKMVLQLTRWVEEPRSKPKYPPLDSNCEQLFAIARNCASPSSSSSSSNTPSTSPPTFGESDLEAIYLAYPKRAGRPDAIKAIRKALSKGISAQDLLARTQAYAEARIGEDHQFTPYPATWFNQERYNDPPETWRKNGNSNNQSSVGFNRSAAAQRNAAITGAERVRADARAADAAADSGPWVAE